jgi:murein DD-endopeptidase MepM/ murein hydrolase activator NlpD
MTDFAYRSGRPQGRRVPLAAPPWPVHCFLLLTAVVCGFLFVRTHHGMMPALPIERLLADHPAEVDVAMPAIGIDAPASPTAGDFRLVAEEVPDPEPPAPPVETPYDMTLRLHKGDTLAAMLRDLGVADGDRTAIVVALDAVLKKTRLAAGEMVQLSLMASSEAPDAPRVLSMKLRPRPEREYTVTRQEDGSYDGEEKVYEVRPMVVRVATRRTGSLLESAVAAGAPSDAVREFIKALSYGVDFQRELRQGQPFSLLLQEGVTDDGQVARSGRLLAGRLKLDKRTATVIAFQPAHGSRQYYTPDGKSVVRAFLRTPMDASHITSRFGMRRHPILGYSRMHEGVDFAAPTGTPILAAGGGTVTKAGRYGGYGIYVELRHTATISTAYGHMSRLGPGIRPGTHVRQGQVIGFVGSTGLATGPHLHYEFHRRGRAVNPLTQHASMRAHLVGRDLKRFLALVRRCRAAFASAPLVASLH